GHTAEIRDLAFSPDGRWLASCSCNGEVKVWPLELAARPPAFVELGDLTVSAFSSDATGFSALPQRQDEGGFAEFWSIPDFKKVAKVEFGDLSVNCGAILPGLKSCVLGCDDGSLHLRGEVEKAVPGAHHGVVIATLVSADGKTLVSYSWIDNLI